ncbi:unnamed protein product [Ceutorhynchus assimilis]|uniref:Protein-L-isoaspartate O-methyltransferase domain-containing protein 1 n=1 Tax=Ceutorhynchus assimilis TaxID=467358 RepID=A0A9N9MF19_9CUCU|nr:unnamed protein product [Ceutorhynchus assimilis]
MGVAPSTCKSNNDLVESLIVRNFITTGPVERVFRAVDRGEYFPRRIRAHAYNETAWKWENLHISSPCIYAVAMEALELQPAMSFLNLGSGSGFMSTMVGLILGSNGINHGMELQADIVEYANRKLEDFMRLSGAMDEYDFCEPKFVHGNCLSINSLVSMEYDRIYCGAACRSQEVLFLRKFLKTGGIMVLPCNGELLQIKKLENTAWVSRHLLNVSFSAIIPPPANSLEYIKPIDVQPTPLQVLCRTTIRNALKKTIKIHEIQHPPGPNKRKIFSRTRKSKRLKQVIIPKPLPDSSDEDETPIIILPRYSNDGLHVSGTDGLYHPGSFTMEVYSMTAENINRMTPPTSSDSEEEMIIDNVSDDSVEESVSHSVSHQVSVVIEHHPGDDSNPENIKNQDEDDSEVINNDENEQNNENSSQNSVSRQVSAVINHQPHDHPRDDPNPESDENQEDDSEVISKAHILALFPKDEQNNKNSSSDSDMKAGTSGAASRNTLVKRENINSSVNDEIIKVVSSSEDEEKERRRTIQPCRYRLRQVLGMAYRNQLRRRALPVLPSESSSDTDEDEPVNTSGYRMYQSPMTKYMKAKIEKLPLPPPLKNFLLFQ